MFKKPLRKVTKVFLHCSASDSAQHDSIKVIRAWHLERGFSDVGYHCFIKKDGTRQKGRSLELNPAAQKGCNTGSIAICMHGLADFTEAQRLSLLEYCQEIDLAYGHKVTFHGHCEVSNKSCPVYPYKNWLGLDTKGYLTKKEEIMNETKKWYTSKGILGSLLAVGIGVAGALGYDLGAGFEEQANEVIVAGGTFIAGVLALIGRIKATKRIK